MCRASVDSTFTFPGKKTKQKKKSLDAFLIGFIFIGLNVNASYFISVCNETVRWHLVAWV